MYTRGLLDRAHLIGATAELPEEDVRSSDWLLEQILAPNAPPGGLPPRP